jgi:TonB family protein
VPKSNTVSQSITVSGGVSGGAIDGTLGGVPGRVVGGIVRGVPARVPPAPNVLAHIWISGLPEEAKSELLASLPVQEGQTVTSADVARITQAVRAFDEHLNVRWPAGAKDTNETNLQIDAPGPLPVSGVQRIKVGGNVQASMIVQKVPPVYPQLAKSARVSGVVHLQAVIGKDGTVEELKSLGGPALLVQAAIDAVRQWVYRPTMLNGAPVSIETTIDVNFTLEQ